MTKEPIDIPEMMRRIREAVKPFPKAALFELADDGFDSPFEQLVACIVSIRTYDEVMLPIARRLFARARTPEAVAALPLEELTELVRPSTFYERKAAQILRMAERVVEEFDGKLPCEPDVLLSFAGVGPKCANLVLGIACDQPRIGVDVHVHRVTSRWGYVSAPTPERAMVELKEKLPRRYWVEINKLLVPFGKHICKGTLPRCSTCPVLDMCQQVGIRDHN
jgi:endonuclease III